MASEKQIQANRLNARKSTGPRTEVGKARSRLNSGKHGLTARLIVIGDEDPSEFEALRDGLVALYDPQGTTEHELVDYLAGIYWRLRRFPLFEAAIFAARQHQVDTEFEEDEARRRELEDGDENSPEKNHLEERRSDHERLVRIGRTLIKDGIWDDALGKLSRHETTQLNALKKTLTLLEEAQAKRLTQPVTIEAHAIWRAA